MPLTAAQRQAKCRQKKRDKGLYEEAKKKDAERKQRSRQKNKEEECLLPLHKQKKIAEKRRKDTRERVARHRSRKEQWEKQKQDNLDDHRAFGSAQAMGKAVTRAKRALDTSLPNTPRRKKAVCQRLLRCFANPSQVSAMSPKGRRAMALGDDTIELVKKFFERDDISRQAPGRKDSVVVRCEDGSKRKVQARHLTSSIMEVYGMFINEYPEVKIGKSKFASLRPPHVQLSSKLPHNICLCKYHENFRLAVDALHEHCPNIPTYSSELPEKFLCSPPTDSCWYNKCEKCKDGKMFMTMSEMDTPSEATWYIWKNDSEERLSKVVEEGTTDDLRSHIVSIIPQFIEHCHVKRVQAAAYKQERDEIENCLDKALLQVDFSENFTCQYQDEIQSAHWQQRQVSLFTAAFWHTRNLHSIVIASDNLMHSKDTIVSYLDRLLGTLPDSVKDVSIWSDGPASQFKNRFIAAALLTLQQKYNVNIRWNFFATGHGKGPVDGIGGSVKRFVWTAVKQRKEAVVNKASSFVAVAKNMPNVVVYEMSAEDIKTRNEALGLKDVFAAAPAIKGIAQYHCLSIQQGSCIPALLTTLENTEPSDSGAQPCQEDIPQPSRPADNLIQESNNVIEVGDWWIVEYDGEHFPGVVKQIKGENFEVSVMHKTGKDTWKWPSREDKIFYVHDMMKKKLQPPTMVNERDHWGAQFPDFDRM